MANRRISSVGLTRLLASTSTPVYAVNQRREMVYLNPAMTELTGVAAEDLIGKRCDYHDSAAKDPASRLVSDLCPPPTALAGESVCAPVALTKADDTVLRHTAHFLPMYDLESEALAIIAICYAIDENPPSEPSDDAPEQLHMLVRRFRREQRRRFHIDRMIGISGAMKKARARIELAIDSMASVLLIGPVGSGRRHVAQAIHYNSPSAETSTFVPLDGELLGADLLRTTLSALDVRINSPKSDECGTVFLTEVDQISGEVQTILADYLARPKRNVRVIASARGPLNRLVIEGNYRYDLATALTTITIELPSLSRRIEDLPLLAQMFLEQVNGEGEKQVGGFSDTALEMLCEYDWPGNLDQLDQVVREAHAATDLALVGVDDLPRQLHLAADADSRTGAVDDSIDLDEILTDVEKQLITQALRLARGNKAAAARRLGISRPRLLRRIEQLGLES